MCTLLDTCVQATSLDKSERLLSVRTSCDEEGNQVPKHPMSHCLEKLLGRRRRPVPQTDTGSRGEHPKVIERTLVKELGKMTP